MVAVGSPLALTASVRRVVVLGFAIGCGAAPRPYPAVADECNPARVGRVVLDGAAVADVAPLAVLEGAFDEADRTERVTAVATELLNVRGYPRAKITVTRKLACGVELHVAVDRGPQFHIDQLGFATNDTFPAEWRTAVVEDALGTVNAVGGAYVEDRMKRALVTLQHRYRDAGWLDAVIAAPRAIYDDAHGSVTVVVPIHAGPRYRIGNVVAHGAGPTLRAEVVAALGLRGGEWYDAARLRVGIDRARRKLDRRIELHIDVATDRKTIDLVAVVGGGAR
jgi:outer membrane protein assembly factor BamA